MNDKEREGRYHNELQTNDLALSCIGWLRTCDGGGGPPGATGPLGGGTGPRGGGAAP